MRACSTNSWSDMGPIKTWEFSLPVIAPKRQCSCGPERSCRADYPESAFLAGCAKFTLVFHDAGATTRDA
jgi:hypothetical protein